MIKRYQRLSSIQWILLTFLLCGQQCIAYYVTEFNAKIYEPAENDPGSIFNEANEKHRAVYRLLSGPFGKEGIHRDGEPTVNSDKSNRERYYQKGAVPQKRDQNVDDQNMNDIYQRILRNILRNETIANGRLKPANYLSADDKQSYRRHRPPYAFDESKFGGSNGFKYGKFDFDFDRDYSSSDVFPEDRRQHFLDETFDRKWGEDMFDSVRPDNDHIFKNEFGSRNPLDEQVERIDDIEKWNFRHRSKPIKYRLDDLSLLDNDQSSSHRLGKTKHDHKPPKLMKVVPLPSPAAPHTNNYYYKEIANKNKYAARKVLNSYRNTVSSAYPDLREPGRHIKRSVQDQLDELKNDSYAVINSSTTRNEDISDSVRNGTSNQTSNFADEKITKLTDQPMKTYNGTKVNGNAAEADITEEIIEGKKTVNETNFPELTTKAIRPNENKSDRTEKDPLLVKLLTNDSEEMYKNSCQQHGNDTNACLPIRSGKADQFKPDYFSRSPVTGFLITYVRNTEIVQPIYVSKFQHDFVTGSTDFKDDSGELVSTDDNNRFHISSLSNLFDDFNISAINALVPDNVTSASSEEDEIDNNNLSQAIYHDIFDNSSEQHDNQTVIDEKKHYRNNRVDKTYLYHSSPDRILGNVLNYLTYVQPPVELRTRTEYYDLNILSKHANNNFTIID